MRLRVKKPDGNKKLTVKQAREYTGACSACLDNVSQGNVNVFHVYKYTTGPWKEYWP